MDSATASTTDANAVDDLLAEMQGEAGLAVNAGMTQANRNKIAAPQQAVAEKDDVSDIEARLAALKM